MSISDELLDEGGAFHNVRAAEFGAVGTGGVDDGLAFQDAGAQGHILVPAGIYRVDNSFAIPRAMRLVDGAVLRPASGVVITLDGPVEAGPYKIFDLSLGGTVVLGSNSGDKLYPEWWGAIGDGIADDTSAIQAAIDAVAAGGGGTVYISVGTYVITSALTISGGNVHLHGIGRGSIIKAGAAMSNMVVVSGAPLKRGGSIEYLRLDAGVSQTGVLVWMAGETSPFVTTSPRTRL